MQNRYVGDVGDFGKYGLLRALCRSQSAKDPALRLGVVWYLTSDETHNNDGRHTSYLEPTPKNVKSFRRCDPDLYDLLGHIVRTDARRVSAIRQWDVLPEDTVYYDRILDFRGEQVRPTSAARIRARREWVQGALQATKNCDIVFVDPDNGIGTSDQAHSRRGGKYVLLEELGEYVDRGQTLVVYHHLNRSATADIQIKSLSVALRDLSPRCRHLTAARFRRGSARVFFLISQEKHETTLERRLGRFLTTAWSTHYCCSGFYARPSKDISVTRLPL